MKLFYLGNGDKLIYFCVWAENETDAKAKALARIEKSKIGSIPDFDFCEEFTPALYDGVLMFY